MLTGASPVKIRYRTIINIYFSLFFKTNTMNKCILCNNTFTGWGHNPEPLEKSHFKCCNHCNTTRVLPYRIYKFTNDIIN